jgi:hypothetical protein
VKYAGIVSSGMYVWITGCRINVKMDTGIISRNVITIHIQGNGGKGMVNVCGGNYRTVRPIVIGCV